MALEIKKEQSGEDSDLKCSQIQEQFKQNVDIQKRSQVMYEWLYTQLEYTNRAIAPVLTAFRFRSIKQEYMSLYNNESASSALLGKRTRPAQFDEELQDIIGEISKGFKRLSDSDQKQLVEDSGDIEVAGLVRM